MNADNAKFSMPLENTSVVRTGIGSSGQTHADLAAGNALRASEVHAATKVTSEDAFSIDELREMARHFGVSNRAMITERSALIREIRRRL